MTCTGRVETSDKGFMCIRCPGMTRFAALSRAAAKAAGARLRRLGILPQAGDWAARAGACERCPMRTVYVGVTYCGRPLLHQVARDPSAEGCGCPTAAKAKRPGEHCPLDRHNRPAVTSALGCTCKWCSLG